MRYFIGGMASLAAAAQCVKNFMGADNALPIILYGAGAVWWACCALILFLSSAVPTNK